MKECSEEIQIKTTIILLYQINKVLCFLFFRCYWEESDEIVSYPLLVEALTGVIFLEGSVII